MIGEEVSEEKEGELDEEVGSVGKNKSYCDYKQGARH